MSGEIYYIDRVITVKWLITDATTGQPVDDSTLSGIVRQPDATDAAMTVTRDPANGALVRFTFPVTMSGKHGVRVKSTGTAVDAQEFSIIVRRSEFGLPPIENDPTTPVGLLRVYVPDMIEDDPLFEDAALAAILTAEGGNLKRAAAACCSILAASEVMISKVIQTQDLRTDGAKVADALLARAKQLRAEADEPGAGPADAFAAEIIAFDGGDCSRWGRW